MLVAAFLSALTEATDPVSAFLQKDWGAVSGWGLFFALVVFITYGNFKEWWVPGPRYHKLEDAAKLQSETLSLTVKTLDEQVRANEITKHFFEETVPRRRDAPNEQV